MNASRSDLRREARPHCPDESPNIATLLDIGPDSLGHEFVTRNGRHLLKQVLPKQSILCQSPTG